jgi:HD-GYP domain-containing protein (c-di-GMP phosphodiesterase class II)
MGKLHKYHYSIIFLLLVFTWLTAYMTNGLNATINFFYFPVILAGRFWGIRGGIGVGLFAGLLGGPFLPDNVSNDLAQSNSQWLIRLCFYVVIGIFVGKLFSLLFRQRNAIENQEQLLAQFSIQLVDTLAQSIEVRDSYTSGHCDRVSDMSVRIGESMGLEQRELLRLKWSAKLHDIGKIGIPEAILTKEGKLTEEEYAVIKQHPELGRRILNDIPDADTILGGVMHHHERLDGKGYPYGLSGDQIGMQARIIAVSDVWDALTSRRSYRDAISHNEALNIMQSGRGSHFDPVVLDHFIKIIDQESVKEARNVQ